MNVRLISKSLSLQILSMIEEAAGTRMYESKKQNAQRTITKKDAKLNEIDTVCNGCWILHMLFT